MKSDLFNTELIKIALSEESFDPDTELNIPLKYSWLKF